ncbi:FAD-dependent oxidoreductase [Salinicoccus albus]|uniref:FAD-dependent oxidoreductase n=1 Tax=Salinicoccus albus TaxID=418756 RepID=UPI000379C829|nr:FAD-dependent monooxygenase [Salinicoccus albus]
MMDKKVLVAGSGPTGLAMAAGLEKHGVPFRIIDKAPAPGGESRAMIVHARTLEMYDQFGLAEEMINRGIILNNVSFFNEGKRRARFNLEDIGEGLSSFPFVLSLPQDEHERIITDYLKRRNIEIEWETELIDLEETEGTVKATIEKQGSRTIDEYEYVAGCDGVGSTVRKSLDFDFPGGTYEEMFFVTDLVSKYDIDGVQVHLFEAGFALLLPVRTTGSVRVIGLVPENIVRQAEDIGFEDIEAYLKGNIGITASKVNWFSTYNVHHRVSENFRRSNVFILGDAGHVHSPAGGQGMNTGIGDAMNLSWKLAEVIDGKLDREALATYEPERIAFARLLVNTTDEVFKAMVGSGSVFASLRGFILPNVIPGLLNYKRWKKMMFRLVSQIHIDYNQSDLSKGRAGRLRGGDRLPWVPYYDGDNHDALKSFEWQYHLYGQTSVEMRKHIKKSGIELHEFNWTAEVRSAGIKKNTVMLVRPDGYIAVIDNENNVERFFEYVQTYLKGF